MIFIINKYSRNAIIIGKNCINGGGGSIMARKKHIVFIVDSYYPNYSANGICVKKIIDTLKHTHNITVICTKNKKGLQDIEDYDSIRLIRIETVEYKTRNYANSVLENSKSKYRKFFIPLSSMKSLTCTKLIKQIGYYFY